MEITMDEKKHDHHDEELASPEVKKHQAEDMHNPEHTGHEHHQSEEAHNQHAGHEMSGAEHSGHEHHAAEPVHGEHAGHEHHKAEKAHGEHAGHTAGGDDSTRPIRIIPVTRTYFAAILGFADHSRYRRSSTAWASR